MKTIRLSRAAVCALAPKFAQKIISREVTLALSDAGEVAVEPGKIEDLKTELAERFQADALLTAEFAADDLQASRAFLYRVCHGKWPEGYEQAEKLAALEHEHLIRDVEIFSTGTHNGDVYTEQDLDDMVAAHKALDYKPALKIGHVKDKPGSPAFGYVENLRRIGTKLLADFSSMHGSVVDAIRNKSYNRVSSEIYFNFKRGERTFRRALKAVALLGAEVPAVANLVPLHKVQFSDEGFEKLSLASESELSVANEAVVACLSERVAALTTLVKEFADMKTAAQVKEEIRKLNEQVAALSAKGKKDEDPDMKKCKEDIARLSAEVSALETAEKANAENAALRATVAMLTQKDRQREVQARVAALTIPAFAPAMTALFEHALALPADAPKLKVYSKKEGKDITEEKSLSEVCDTLLGQINEHAKKTFKVFDDKSGRVERQEGTAGEKAADKLDALANEYLVKHPDLKGDYAAAFEQVCKEQPELAKQYADEQNPARAN